MNKNNRIIEQIGELFQEYSKYQYFTKPSAMVTGAAAPALQKEIPENAVLVDLPGIQIDSLPAIESLATIMHRRASRRKYSQLPLSQQELSFLLWATQGVKDASLHYSLRIVPSAGARHPLETYLAINRVHDLQAGLYRYLPLDHKLIQLKRDDSFSQKLAEACLGQRMFVTCAVAFIWTAIIERSRWKYQQRAFRYVYLDAGHVCQNLYLACEVLNIGCCAVAAFDDDAVNQLIPVDGQEEFVVYSATVGKR